MPGMIQPQRIIEFHPDGTASVQVKPLFGGDFSAPRTLKMTQQQYEDWQRGQYIQNAMPHLTAGEREFLMSGTTEEQWDETFKEDE